MTDNENNFRRAKNEAVLLTETLTRLEFGESLVKEKLLEADVFESYRDRQLKAVKTHLGYLFSQLDLQNVESRVDQIFKADPDPKEHE